MADVRTPAEIDQAAVEKFNEILRKSLDREKKLLKHYEWKGNKLPPFSIEPMPHQRQRLATPMTAEDRALRKQWVLDQHLSPNEPRHIPELHPKNFFRRMAAMPWDGLFGALKPVLGSHWAAMGRYYVPRLTMTYVGIVAVWYHLKYIRSSWDEKGNWHVIATKDKVLPGDQLYGNEPVKQPQDFHNKGFTHRKVFVGDYETSNRS